MHSPTANIMLYITGAVKPAASHVTQSKGALLPPPPLEKKMERLRDCMQELVKFTLETYINEAAEFDIGISKEFCSNLLQDEDDPLDQYPRSSAGNQIYDSLSIIHLIFMFVYREDNRNETGFSYEEIKHWFDMVLDNSTYEMYRFINTCASPVINLAYTVSVPLHFCKNKKNET